MYIQESINLSTPGEFYLTINQQVELRMNVCIECIASLLNFSEPCSLLATTTLQRTTEPNQLPAHLLPVV